MKKFLLSLLILLSPATLRAEPVRVLVAAGQAHGLPEQGVLNYADQDAERMRSVFVSLGRVQRKHALIVRGATDQTLLAALDRAKAIASRYKRSEVTFIFYFSGHGDRTHLDLDGKSVPLDEIKRRIDAVPAGLHLTITDACRTTEPTRGKGMSETAPFSIAVEAPPASGSVWLYASADGEAAQESDSLAGAVFTHFLVTGLKGAADSNHDRRVTLSEAWSFAYHQTLYRSARGSGVLQRPAAEYRLAENAPLVLTYRDLSSARLSFPAGRDTHYLVYATGSKTVAAEVWATPEGSTDLALGPGRYLVQRRGAAGPGALEISLSAREQHTLNDSEFRPVGVEELASKGGALILRPHEAFVHLGAATGSLGPILPRVAVGAANRFGDLRLALELGGMFGSHTDGMNDVKVRAFDATLSADWVFGREPLSVRVGLGPTALWISETVRRTDAARLEPLGYDVENHYQALGAGGALNAAIRFQPTPASFLELVAVGAALGVRRESGLDAIWLARAEVGGGLLF